MENLEKTITYTQKKKKFQLRDNDAELKDQRNELFGYLKNEEDDSSVGLNFERLSNQHLWQFIDLYLQEKELSRDLLAKSTHYAIEANNWEFAIGTLSPTYDDAIQLKYSTMHLGQALHLGWVEQAKSYGNLLLKMLYGKQYTGGNASATYPWFIIELFCKWQAITLDQSKLHYPQDMSVYKSALDNWNTSDTTLLSKIIDELSDFHIKQSNEDVSTDEYGNEFSPEFTSSDYFIFPVEILTWLAIRKDMGLPSYTPTNNSLMQLEINQLPKQSISYPNDELIEKCKAKLLADNNKLKFEM